MDKDTSERKHAKTNCHWSNTMVTAGHTERQAHGCVMVTAGHTGYMTRLTALRDSLVQQEQLYLARAVDRLRAHSLSNKATSRRLRMAGSTINKSPATLPRNNLMTTAEKFRQMRPKDPRPVILPLLGTQIFDRNSSKRENSPEGVDLTDRGTDTSGTTAGDGETWLPHISQADDMVQKNLQRLRKTSRSIPNIERKARIGQERPEPKIKSLVHLRPRFHRQNGRRLASLFLPFNNSSLSSSQASPDMAQLHFPINNNDNDSTPRIEYPIFWQPEVNPTHEVDETEKMLKNNPRYFANCIRPECRELKGNCVHNENYRKLECKSCTNLRQSSKKIGHLKKQMMTHYGQPSFRELQQMEAVVINRKISYGYKDCSTIKDTNNVSNNTDNVITENSHRDTYIQPQKVKIRNGRISSHGNVDEYGTSRGSKESPLAVISRHQYHREVTSNSLGDFSIKIVPLLLQNGTESRKGKRSDHTEVGSNRDVQENRANRKHIIVNIPREDTQENRKQNEDNSIDVQQTDRQENGTRNKHITVDLPGTDTQRNKIQNKHIIMDTYSKETRSHENNIIADIPQTNIQEIRTQNEYIVVDMPSIILNAPSPVPEHLSNDKGKNEIQNQNAYYESSLKKATLQQEIRLRELANLLEDVKDLSTKTEILQLKSTTEAFLHQNIF